MNVKLKESMSGIVEKTLKNYKEDFYDYDLPILENAPKDSEFIWCLRETGTHLLPVDRFCDIKLGTEILKYNDEYYKVNVSKPVPEKISREVAEEAVRNSYDKSFDKMEVNEARVFNNTKDPRNVKYFLVKLDNRTAEILEFLDGGKASYIYASEKYGRDTLTGWREAALSGREELLPPVPGKGFRREGEDEPVLPYGYAIRDYNKFIDSLADGKHVNEALVDGKATALYFDRKPERLVRKREKKDTVSLSPESGTGKGDNQKGHGL